MARVGLALADARRIGNSQRTVSAQGQIHPYNCVYLLATKLASKHVKAHTWQVSWLYNSSHVGVTGLWSDRVYA